MNYREMMAERVRKLNEIENPVIVSCEIELVNRRDVRKAGDFDQDVIDEIERNARQIQEYYNSPRKYVPWL
jgi:hypothetical protein